MSLEVPVPDIPSDDSQSDSNDSESQDSVENVKNGLSKPKKRKRALSPDAFGQQLTSLLALPAEPSTKSLARIHRPLHKTSAQESSDRKRAKLKIASKHDKQERGHIRDVIGSWPARPARPFSEWPKMTQIELDQCERVVGGGEGEKELRRLAQRGVVKLFNAIRAAQGTTEDDVKAIERAAPKAIQNEDVEVPVVSIQPEMRQPNALGSKGKEQALANLSKESFLQILKSQVAQKS